MEYKHFLAGCLLIVALLAGCKEKQTTNFNRYISGYTSGIIKSSSPVSVYLTQKPDKNFQPGSDLPAEILQFSPADRKSVV